MLMYAHGQILMVFIAIQQVPIFSKRVAFKRLHIAQGAHPGHPENPDHHSNTDGFDPVGSEDASFEDSYYEGPGDDCVAIKSGIQVNWTIPYVDLCKRSVLPAFLTF